MVRQFANAIHNSRSFEASIYREVLGQELHNLSQQDNLQLGLGLVNPSKASRQLKSMLKAELPEQYGCHQQVSALKVICAWSNRPALPSHGMLFRFGAALRSKLVIGLLGPCGLCKGWVWAHILLCGKKKTSPFLSELQTYWQQCSTAGRSLVSGP